MTCAACSNAFLGNSGSDPVGLPERSVDGPDRLCAPVEHARPGADLQNEAAVISIVARPARITKTSSAFSWASTSAFSSAFGVGDGALSGRVLTSSGG
jgi:hypothetical protein